MVENGSGRGLAKDLMGNKHNDISFESELPSTTFLHDTKNLLADRASVIRV